VAAFKFKLESLDERSSSDCSMGRESINEELWKHLCEYEAVSYCSITDFKGLTIGINASSWLQKALSSSIEALIDNNFSDYMFYVDQILSKVRNFRIAGVEPVMVFEGRRTLLKVLFQFHSTLTSLRLRLRSSRMNWCR
jgi:hypothetical protein